VIAQIHDAGGIASLAHPGLLEHDDWIPDLAARGLDAIEAYHSGHDPVQTAGYLSTAKRLKLGISGGSDYHGDDSHGDVRPGGVSLPPSCFDDLVSRHAGICR
jgi:predicted metal-dependent phosphoesterase TrpH